MVTLEQLFDKIADKLILSEHVNPDVVRRNQKSIRDGVISHGRAYDDLTSLILFQRDEKANQEDLKGTIVNEQTQISMGDIVDMLNADANTSINDVTIDLDYWPAVWISGPGLPTDGLNVESLLSSIQVTAGGAQLTENPLNISQFSNVPKLMESIDTEKAEEYLDSTIYELLPDPDERQDRIDAFFSEFDALTNNPPEFQMTGGLVGENFDSNQYHYHKFPYMEICVI